MRALLLAAALSLVAVPASAACFPKDIAGEWLVDIGILTFRGDGQAVCRGRIDNRGRMKTSNCAMISVGTSTYVPSIELILKIKRSCAITGTLNYRPDRDGGVVRNYVLSVSFSADKGQVVGTATSTSDDLPGVGRLTATRLAE